jgi:hypothetical protein
LLARHVWDYMTRHDPVFVAELDSKNGVSQKEFFKVETFIGGRSLENHCHQMRPCVDALLNIRALEPHCDRAFGEPQVLRKWFCGFVSAHLSDRFPVFYPIGEDYEKDSRIDRRRRVRRRLCGP